LGSKYKGNLSIHPKISFIEQPPRVVGIVSFHKLFQNDIQHSFKTLSTVNNWMYTVGEETNVDSNMAVTQDNTSLMAYDQQLQQDNWFAFEKY